MGKLYLHDMDVKMCAKKNYNTCPNRHTCTYPEDPRSHHRLLCAFPNSSH